MWKGYHKMHIFEILKSGEAIHMINVLEYHAVAHKEMDRCRNLSFQINHTIPDRAEIHSQYEDYSNYIKCS